MTSKPLSIENAILKLQSITLGLQTQRVDADEVIRELNEASGTNLKVSTGPSDIAPAPSISSLDNVPKPTSSQGGLSSMALLKSVSPGARALALDTHDSMLKGDYVALAKNFRSARRRFQALECTHHTNDHRAIASHFFQLLRGKQRFWHDLWK